MDHATWEPIYREILRDMGYDARLDEAARDELDALLAPALPAPLPDLRGKAVIVLGPAPAPRVPDGPLLVADPRVVPPRRPDAIVTDLDGDVALQIALNAVGVPTFIHAHGDNREALREHAPRFRGPVTGTCQAPPRGRVRNYGGFTDGDRACCLAVEAGASSLILAGFDLTQPVEKPGRDAATKTKKLAWARRILDALPVPITNA